MNLDNLTFEQAKIIRDSIEAEWDKVGNALKEYPRGAMGLTLDSAKDSRWHNLMKESDKCRKNLQTFNKFFVKKFKKEILAERLAKHGY